MSEPMTDQEVFNKVWEGLKSQGFQRSMIDNSCAYHGDNGLKCAVGHLIPDEELVMEGLGVFSNRIAAVLHEAGVRNLDLVHDLQLAHDNNNIPAEMAAKLAKVATQYGLAVSSQPSLPL